MRRQQKPPSQQTSRLEGILLVLLVLLVFLIVLSWINHHFGGGNHLNAKPALPLNK
jgi:hypothetical protein